MEIYCKYQYNIESSTIDLHKMHFSKTLTSSHFEGVKTQNRKCIFNAKKSDFLPQELSANINLFKVPDLKYLIIWYFLLENTYNMLLRPFSVKIYLAFKLV